MYRVLAREVLSRLWGAVAAARQRPLDEADQREIWRLCGILQDQPGISNELYRSQLEQLCLAVASGVHELSPSEEAKVDALLKQIDHLLEFIAEKGRGSG